MAHVKKNERTLAKFDVVVLDGSHMDNIEKRIKLGEEVDGSEIIEALGGIKNRSVSKIVLEHLRLMLDDSVPKPKGRKSKPKTLARRYNMIIGGCYRKYLSKLTERKYRHGNPAGWTDLDGTPAEIAARIVARRFSYGEESWRSVQNIASSYK